MTVISTTLDSRQALWLRRIALGGFWFFLAKGLLWLAAPLVFYYFI